MILPGPNAAKCEETIARVLSTIDAFVLMVDADGLKGINDKYGHSAGTAYLTEIWERLNNNFKNTLWQRYGGDEFYGVVAASQTSEQELLRKAEEIHGLVNVHGREIRIAISMGIYRAEKSESVIAAMAMADRAMYQVKKIHHGGANVFAADKTLVLIGSWSEEWITAPIHEGWRVLITPEETLQYPEGDLVVATKSIHGRNVWVPESLNVSELLQKLSTCSNDPLEEATIVNLIWDECEEIESDTQDEISLKKAFEDPSLFDQTGTMIDNPNQFIPWRTVHESVWHDESSHVATIVLDDPLVVPDTVPRIEKAKNRPLKSTQTNDKKPAKTPKSKHTFKIPEALSTFEIPRLELPQIKFPQVTLKMPDLPAILPNFSKELKELPNTSVPINNQAFWFKGQTLWCWGDSPGSGVTQLATEIAEYLANSIPVLLLEGNFNRPKLCDLYPHNGLGWEASWFNKTPGIPPENCFTKDNLTVWSFKNPTNIAPSTDMWDVALFHIRSPNYVVIIDGGTFSPSDVDHRVQLVTFPNQEANPRDLRVSRMSLPGAPEVIHYKGDPTLIVRRLIKVQEE